MAKKRNKKKVKEKLDIKKYYKKLIKDKKDKQLLLIILFIVLIIGGFLGTYFIIQSSKTFDYAGVSWVKEKYGNMTFYHARFKILEGFPIYNAYFRTDPRKNDVEIAGNAYFRFYQKTYVSLNPNIEECSGANVLANKLLGEFLGATNVVAESAVEDKNLSEELGYPYIDCDSIQGKNESAIIIQKSDYPYISQIGPSCYLLEVGECENIKTAEAFILGIMNQLSELEQFMTNQ